MTEPSPSPIPTPLRSLVLADIAVQADEAFGDIAEPAELARRAMRQTWTVTYASHEPPGLLSLPGQQVTDEDLPLLLPLFEELRDTDLTPPYDLKELLAGAARRITSVNAGDVDETPPDR